MDLKRDNITLGAVNNVDRSLIPMGQGFGLSGWGILRKVVLQGTSPRILSALRALLATGIVRLFDVVTIFAVLGLPLSAAVSSAEKQFPVWRE